MPMTHINPDALSKPTGYSHVVTVTGGKPVFIAGQVSLDRQGNVVGVGDLKAQARQVYENLKTALAAAGATFKDVTKITTFLTRIDRIAEVREVRAAYFQGAEPPASTTVGVTGLARPELLIEIEAVAFVEGAS
jgi:enamine deaminase RidA (YjgF/YER057c/UK114 family)